MKRYLLILSVSGLCQVVYPQGTVNFSNLSISGGGVNAPVYQSDGVTKLSGSQFLAELLAGPSATSLASIDTTGFLTGVGAGYFAGGTVAINNVSPGAVGWVQVDVWNTLSGGTFTQAEASGLPNSWWQSSIFTVVAGGGGINPFPPAVLTGLGNAPVFLNGVVPEPSTLALCLVAAVMAALRFR